MSESIAGPGYTVPGSYCSPGGDGSSPPPNDPFITGRAVVESGPPAPVPHRPKKLGKIALGLVGALLTVAAVGLGAYLFWWRSSAPSLAKYAPKNTAYYVEIPSLPKLAISLSGVDVLDGDELDFDEHQKELVETVADSFELRDEEAEDLLLSMRSIAFAGRENADPEENDHRPFVGVLLMKVSDAEAMDPLLDSKRFDKDGAFAGGTKYVVSRRERHHKTDDDGLVIVTNRGTRTVWQELLDDLGERQKPDEDALEREPSAEDAEAEDARSKLEDVCVWFDEEALFACGAPEMVKEVGEVIAGSEDSLASGNEQFARARWEAGASLVEYFDPTLLSDLKKDFFDDVAPYTTTLHFEDEGLVTRSYAELRGKKIDNTSGLVPEKVDLDLYEKLPADTFAYVAGSSKLEISGKEYVKLFTKALQDGDEEQAEELQKSLDATEEYLGVDVATLIDAAGDQFVLAVTAEDKAMSVFADDGFVAGAKRMGFAAIVELRDVDAANKIVKSLKSKAEELAESSFAKDAMTVKKRDDGFSISVDEDLEKFPVDLVRVEIVDDKYLLVSAGGKKRVDAIRDAFDGDGDLLEDDRAHKNALAVLDTESHVLLWVDTGRVARTFLKGSSEIKRMARKKGVAIDALILEGDDRITTGLSIRAALHEDGYAYEATGLNYPLLLASAAPWLMLRRATSRAAEAVKVEQEATPALSAPATSASPAP